MFRVLRRTDYPGQLKWAYATNLLHEYTATASGASLLFELTRRAYCGSFRGGLCCVEILNSQIGRECSRTIPACHREFLCK